MSTSKISSSPITSETAPTEEDKAESQLPDFSSELKIIETFTPPTVEAIKSKEVLLGPKTKKNLLVLDIDRTLVYSTFEAFGMGPSGKRTQSFSVSKRPYVINLLEKLKKLYEIVLFTSGVEEYANAIRRCLDPNGNRIMKVLSRSSCFLMNEQYYVKDLRIFGDRDIKNVVIVDDSVFSFAFQLNNGIPVQPFTGDNSDDELVYLINYLEDIYDSDDISLINKERIEIAKGNAKSTL